MNDVQMAKFATDVKPTFTDIRREDRGSIIGLSKVCLQYIIDAMDWKADIVGMKRTETPEIPVDAVREAIINSYGHRLYNNNQCNEIDVFKDLIFPFKSDTESGDTYATIFNIYSSSTSTGVL